MEANRRDLTAMLRPRSIALVGATDRSRWSQNTFDNLVNRKYAGDIYLVSRRGGTVHGRSAATSCVAVGAPIDLALLMVPMAAIDEALADLAAADVHNAVILTSGFAETGHEGADLYARRHHRFWQLTIEPALHDQQLPLADHADSCGECPGPGRVTHCPNSQRRR